MSVTKSGAASGTAAALRSPVLSVPLQALWPAEPKARARARLIEHKSDEVYFPPIVRLMGLQSRPDDPAAITPQHRRQPMLRMRASGAGRQA